MTGGLSERLMAIPVHKELKHAVIAAVPSLIPSIFPASARIPAQQSAVCKVLASPSMVQAGA